MRVFPKSIIGQLIAGTVVMQILLLMIFYLLVVRPQIADNDQRAILRLQGQTTLLAGLIQQDVADNDLGHLQTTVEGMRSSPVIHSARVTDLNGTTVAVSELDPDSLDPIEREQLKRPLNVYRTFPGSNGEMEAVAPVKMDGKVLGLAWIKIDPVVAERATKSLLNDVFWYALFALLVNILLAFLLARTVTRPLRKLLVGTQQLIHDPSHSLNFPLPVSAYNEAGELTQSFNTMVRELHEQRAGLNETLALLDSMLANAPIGFAFYDRRFRYIRINQFLAEIHGLSIERHLGRTLNEILPPAIAREKERHIKHVFTTGEAVIDVEMFGGFPDDSGVQRSWVYSFYPVRSGEEEVRWVGAIVVETTQRRQADDALRKNEKLAAAGRLAASIAHEINNPLEAVTNLLYLLSSQPSLDPEARAYAGLAQSELARVSQITQQTLRFYRQSTQPVYSNLAEIIDSVLLLHQARIHAAETEVVRKYGETKPLLAFGGELRQLFANLIGNALDAMGQGGRLTISIYESRHWQAWPAQAECGVRVTVADSGTGMTDEVKRRIFEPFFTTKETTGTGLGLWVSEEIVSKHSGTMKIHSRSKAPSGTVFMLYFPYNAVEKKMSTPAATHDA